MLSDTTESGESGRGSSKIWYCSVINSDTDGIQHCAYAKPFESFHDLCACFSAILVCFTPAESSHRSAVNLDVNYIQHNLLSPTASQTFRCSDIFSSNITNFSSLTHASTYKNTVQKSQSPIYPYHTLRTMAKKNEWTRGELFPVRNANRIKLDSR